VEPTLWPLLTRCYQWGTPRLDLDSLSPVLVLGNQKTGSTAIAELLAQLGGLRATTDLHPLQATSSPLPSDATAVAALLQRLRYYFRADLIKENELTLITSPLLSVLPRARPVFVVRHPAHNIRSILDRVGLPGTPRPLDALSLAPGDEGWRPILTGSDLGVEAKDTITALAKRWARTTAIYQRHRERLRLVRYEDFMTDKSGCIQALAEDLGVPARHDIDALVDVSFQPRGAHRDVPVNEFFSSAALARIHEHCADGMSALEYAPVSPSVS
jgi:hypothetical protein